MRDTNQIPSQISDWLDVEYVTGSGLVSPLFTNPIDPINIQCEANKDLNSIGSSLLQAKAIKLNVKLIKTILKASRAHWWHWLNPRAKTAIEDHVVRLYWMTYVVFDQQKYKQNQQ